MKLDDLDTVRKLAESRKLLLHKAAMLDAEAPAAGMFLSYTFDADACDFLRRSLADRFRYLAGVAEAGLRELGVTLPSVALPEADPGPKHAFLRPNSWDPKTGQFTVWVPCTPARSWRKKAKADGDVEVDEALNPHGLKRDELARVTVEDATYPYRDWPRCGLVVGSTATDQGVEIRVRLDPDEGPMRGAIASGRISGVGIGYEGLEETIVSASGDRPLVNVHRWRLHEIRLHRADSLAEAA